MLTVAYCRVSTEEQAAEGFSIAGQADKLRVYAELHDLGEVTVIADPGCPARTSSGPGSSSCCTWSTRVTWPTCLRGDSTGCPGTWAT